jgi:hypothetical protein
VIGAAILPQIRTYIAPGLLVAAGSLAFAIVAIGAAMLRNIWYLCPVMLVGGIAWLSVLSTLNVAAQQASPSWVRARALAIYLIVFQAGMAGGSALWGVVALHAGLSTAYFAMAGGLLLGGALAIRLKPAADEIVDHTPAHHWPEPLVTGEVSLEAGPIMVQVEYSVDPMCSDAFRSAMSELGRNRRRDGAVQWWLFRDTADPSLFIETWIEATWAEHLRNHERVSVAHQELEQRIRGLTKSGSTIATRHFIAPEPSNAAVNAIEERIGGLARW